jgi:EAL and modified HD-GYP domain-containing signal transduction protein
MRVFVGRQPILGRNLRTYAYELLFRSGASNCFDGADGVSSTAAVITNTFLSIGADRILGDSKAFINFPREMLVDGSASALPRATTVIEILETVSPDKDLIRGCRHLKDQGYLLALDDFAKGSACVPLVDLADFIKVDFRASSREDCREMAGEYGRRGIRMLAEKVETKEEFDQARSMGYGYFQGYFFARPQMISARDVPPTKLNSLRILRELHQPEIDFPGLEKLIRLEVSLAHKLLRYVNSAVFGWNGRIESLRHALVALGEDDIRKWVSLAAMPGLVSDKPVELVRTSLTRARLCELIAERAGLAYRSSDCFLMGLFSLLDAMIGRPLPELMGELGLARDVREALAENAGSANRLGNIYDLCLACEAADPDAVEKHRHGLALSLDSVAEMSVDAMAWSQLVCREPGIPR